MLSINCLFGKALDFIEALRDRFEGDTDTHPDPTTDKMTGVICSAMGCRPDTYMPRERTPDPRNPLKAYVFENYEPPDW